MLRKALQSAVCLLLSPLLVAQSTQIVTVPIMPNEPPTPTSPLPKGAQIVQFITLEDVSSETAKKGQPVRMALATNVTLGNTIVVPAGTPTVGKVFRIQKAIPGKKDGYLELMPDYVTLANGTHLQVRQYAIDETGCAPNRPCWGLIPVVILMGIIAAPFIPIQLAVMAFHGHPHHPRETRDDVLQRACAGHYFGYVVVNSKTPSTPPKRSGFSNQTATVSEPCFNSAPLNPSR